MFAVIVHRNCHDVTTSQLVPLRDKSSKRSQSAACCSLAFNPKQRAYLASGDSSGNVQVWQLNWRLATLQSGEQKALNDLCSSSSSSGNEDSATDATDDSNSGSSSAQRHESKHDDDDHTAYCGSSSHK
jgi:hypothetical protein